MKKYGCAFVAILLFASCDSHVKVDTQTIDSAGAKLQRTVEKGADTIASKAGRLIDTLQKRRDSAR